MNKLRKSLVVSVMVLTVLATSGVFNISAVKASASAGDLIKMSGNAAVYYLGADGKRYVFPNSTTYFSWYSDFSGVVTIPATELQSYLLGGNVVMRAGTKMVKITTDPSVYAVEPNGVLRKIQNEAQASDLYGTNWNRKIVDVPDSYFTNYSIGTALASGAIPAGALVKNAGAAAVYYYDGTNYRSVANETALSANRFDMANILTLSNTIIATGSAITGAETALIKTSQGAVTGPVITGSGLMVSLSSDTAPAASVVQGQAIADFGSFNLTASNDGAAIITSIKLKRTGISSDAALTNVYLYEGNTKLTDAGSLSSGYVTFANNLGVVTVAAGTTKKITVRADISATATGNIGMSINAASDIISTSASVSGSFPVSGNLMSAVTVTDLATVVVAGAGVATGSGNVNAGVMNTTLWSNTLTVGSKAVNLKYVSFKQIGSIASDAIQNLKLYVDGTQAGSAVSISSDNRVTFDLSAAPVLMATGARTLELRGDIIKGSNSTFIFSAQTAADLVLVDTNYNVNIAATGLPSATATATINTGTIVVSADPTFATSQVVKNSSNVTLAKYTMKAYGENMKVSTLNVVTLLNNNTAINDGISDLAIYVNGAQVGSSQNALAASTGTSTVKTKTYGTTNLFTILAGETAVVEIKGTLTMNDVLTTATSVTTNLAVVLNAYQGVTSYATSPAAGNYATKALTIVSTGLATLSKNNSFASTQTITSNVQKQKIGSFVLQAGSSADVKVSNIAVALKPVASTTIADISNLYLSIDPTTIIGNPVATTSVNNFSQNFTVTAGQTRNIDVYADIAQVAGVGAGTLQVEVMTVSARTVGTNLTADSTQSGQILTFAAASVANPTLVSTDAPAKLVIGGTTDTAVALKFVATNSAAKLKSLKFNIHTTASSNTAEGTTINSLTIGTVTAPVTYDGTDYVAWFDKTLNIDIPVGSVGVTVPVTANYNTVGTNAVASRATSNLMLVTFGYQIGSNAQVDSASALTITSNTNVSVAAKPVITLSTGQSTASLGVGTQEAVRFDVTATGGPVNFRSFSILPSMNGVGTTSVVGVYELSDMSNNLYASTTQLTSATSSQIILIADNVISASQTKTYVVKVSIAGLGAVNTNNVSLSVENAVDTGVSTGAFWQWNDITTGTYGNGYLLKTLPLQGPSLRY